jgi:hypothetical protein
MAKANYVATPRQVQIKGVTGDPSTNPIRTAHQELLRWLAEHPPYAIPIDAHGADLEGRAEHLHDFLSRTSAYLALLLRDAAESVPELVDLRMIDALLADLTSEVAGTLRKASQALPGRLG